MNAIATTVKGAVQNTLNGKTMGEVVNDLDRNDLKKSYAAIDAAYDIVIRKDGLDDTAKRMKSLQDDIGEQVYEILKISMAHCEDKVTIAKAYFSMLCKKAEEYFLSKYVKENREETTIAKAIPLWPAYKTSLLKGMDIGMSPSENIQDTTAPRWPTAAKFRTEVQKREKDAKGGNSQAGNGGRNSTQQNTTVVSLVTKGWSPSLAASMAVLVEGLNRLTHEEQDGFATKLLALGEEVTNFANSEERKNRAPQANVVTDESGKVTGTTSVESEQEEEELDAGTKAAIQAAMDAEKEPTKASTGRKGRGARAA